MVTLSKNSNLLTEMLSRRNEEMETKNLIVKHIESLIENNMILDSVFKISQEIKESLGIEISREKLRRIMRFDMNMSYKKIKGIRLHDNTVKNLILRQQFAKRYIEVSMAKTRIINIDETWLGMEDFRRMKW